MHVFKVDIHVWIHIEPVRFFELKSFFITLPCAIGYLIRFARLQISADSIAIYNSPCRKLGRSSLHLYKPVYHPLAIVIYSIAIWCDINSRHVLTLFRSYIAIFLEIITFQCAITIFIQPLPLIRRITSIALFIPPAIIFMTLPLTCQRS